MMWLCLFYILFVHELEARGSVTDYSETLGLAGAFISRIREGKNYISQNPLGDDIMYKEIRMHFIKQFPYHIHYYIDQNKKQIVIIAIEFSKREDLDFSNR